ncbi:MAG TPA: chloride channel protein [Terriglobales bacterium]|nr:chloride channel protein [Terriglobales bacterium]
MPRSVATNSGTIPTTLARPGALRFWLAVCLIGASTGFAAAALTRLLEVIQRVAWRGSGNNILAAARQAGASRHVVVLLTAGLLTGIGQVILKQLSSGNGIDTTEAIWFHAGRMPAWRTLGSAVLSIFAVGMGASMGREGAPKQAGAVFANLFADKEGLSDEERRLLVACGAGAGMGAAYGVPLGGALFALEVMRGKLALRFVLPALFASLIATGVSWLGLPNAPTYHIPSFPLSASVFLWTLAAAPIFAFGSILYVRLVRWADKNKPRRWQRFIAPAVILGLAGIVSIGFPEILGNGKDLSQLLFADQVGTRLVLALLLLKPLATVMCMRSGVPGGLFTPSLTFGALLGAALGHLWSTFLPGVPMGFFALLGAGAVLSATTQGPISAVVLVMELTGRDRSFVLPLMLIAAISTLIARSIEHRSIYDARLSDEQVALRQKLRERESNDIGIRQQALQDATHATDSERSPQSGL